MSFVKRLLAVVAGTALTCSACSSTADETDSSTVTTSPSSGVPTLPSNVPAPSQDAVDEVDAAFNYYFSEERRALLQEVLDVDAMKVAQDAVSGRIPSSTSGLGGATVPPANGYGILLSEPKPGDDKFSIEMVMKFAKGEVDLSAGVFMLKVVHGDAIHTLIGKYSMNRANEPVPYTSSSYMWHRSTPDADFFPVYRDKASIPDWETSLDPSVRYEIRLDHTGEPATVQQIKDGDAAFLAEIRGLL